MDMASKAINLKLTNRISEMLQKSGDTTAFSLNWSYRYTVLLFMFVFGYYGWGTTSGITNLLDLPNILTVFTLIFSSALLHLRREDFNSYFQKPIKINFGFLAIALFSFLFGIIINYKFLSNSLTVDETAYAWFSQLQTYVITLKIALLLPTQILEINSAFIMQGISIFILLTGLFLLRFLVKIRSDFKFLIIALSLTFLLRGLVQYSGGANGPNSPLSSLWYFTTSSIFGLHNLTYRFSSLAVFCCLSAYLYWRIRGDSLSSKINALLTSLLLFSIPLVSTMSFIVEIANWTFFASVVLFVELARNRFLIDKKVLFFLAIAYYFRVNVITLIITVLLCALLAGYSDFFRDKWNYIYPFCIILPGLVPVIVGRLTDRLTGVGNLNTDISANLRNSISALSLSGSSLYLVIAISSIIILLLRNASRKYILFLITVDVMVFLGLNTPALTLSSKYIIEYLFPLVFVVGLWPTLLGLENRKIFVMGVLITLLAVNTYGFHTKSEIPIRFSKIYNSVNEAKGSATSVVPYSPLAIKEAFRFVHQAKLQPCFNAGVVYSSFPEILEGLPLSQIVTNKQIRKDFLEVQSRIGEDWTMISYESIHASDIKCVILGAVSNQLAVVQELKQNNWSLLGIFPDRNYDTMVYVMSEGKE